MQATQTHTQVVQYTEPSIVRANGIELMYDAFGDPSAPPLLLIMGLGGQLIDWDPDFCAQVAAHGHWVIRFDNRDIGLSTKFNHAGVPNIQRLVIRQALHLRVNVPYLLRDMANDALGLLDALNLASAHIVGVSMGGMIAQTLAIDYPSRVRTLTSIMSSSGARGLPGPTPAARAILLKRGPADRTGYINNAVQTWRVLGGTSIPVGDERARRSAAAAHDRGLNPAGTARQLAAIIASGSRKAALQSIQLPTLVIHGDADPLVPIACGIDTANSIPGAKLQVVKGMGHALPPAAWPDVIDSLCAHTKDLTYAA